MDVKRVVASDYEELCKWWNFWKFPPMPIDCLPTTGVMVYDGLKNLAACFIYSSDSKVCWLEFIVANPDGSKEERKEAIETLLVSAKTMALSMGFKIIFTSCKNPFLIPKLEKHFDKTDSDVSHFIRRL